MRQELIRFAQQLADEDNAASDLWSWLPSHVLATKHHGDQAAHFRPSNREVMIEAAMHLARLQHPDRPVTAEEQEWFQRCPCDEDHEAAA